MYSHDVLVLGAGLAGMRAALEAAKSGANVAMLSKVYPVRSPSNVLFCSAPSPSTLTNTFA